jgi:hypothetical protein
MAQFNFYGSHDDWLSLTEAVLLFDTAYFMPYQRYTIKEPIYLRDAQTIINEYAKRRIRRLFYIGATQFSVSGVVWNMYDSGNKSQGFMITGDAGGPFCQLSLPGAFLVRDVLHLNPGDWFRPQEYWIFDEFGRAIKPLKPSEAVKQGYEQIKKKISSSLKRLKIDGKIARVGADAYRRIMECGARIKFGGKWYRLDEAGKMSLVVDEISIKASTIKPRPKRTEEL